MPESVLQIYLVLFEAQVVGTREGTIIAALLTGVVVKCFTNRLNKAFGRLLGVQQEGECID